MNTSFALDRTNAKLSGVCAGLARTTGTDPFLVRLATVALGLFFAPIVLILYIAIAWIAPDQA
jgi:phage shock protein C